MSDFRGVIKGRVTLNDAPIEGAKVRCVASNLSMYGNFGGLVIEFGDYMLHIFTSTDEAYFFRPATEGIGQVFIVAGGGGGGRYGGGGAGGLIFIHNYSFRIRDYVITVGQGGSRNNAGANSIFDTFTALGGGYGGAQYHTGGSGGSGGGTREAQPGNGLQPTSNINNPPIGYGNKGGPATANVSPYYGNGGGGAGAEAENDRNGGLGLYEVTIAGVTYNFRELFGTKVGFINGDNTEFAGGGGGGSYYESTGRLGRAGGGNGGVKGSGTNAQAGTGSGGGGAGGPDNGGAGGSGIVIIRCKKSDFLINASQETLSLEDGGYIIKGLQNTPYHLSVEHSSGEEPIELFNALSYWNIMPVPQLSSPSNFLLTPGELGSGEIQTDWDEVDNAETYNIEISTNEEFTTIISSTNVETNTHTFINLLDTTPYYCRVRAVADGYYPSEWIISGPSEIE